MGDGVSANFLEDPEVTPLLQVQAFEPSHSSSLQSWFLQQILPISESDEMDVHRWVNKEIGCTLLMDNYSIRKLTVYLDC